MTAPGYTEAGRLEVDVVADLRGFGKKLKAQIEAETAGLKATIGIDIDQDQARARLAEFVRSVSDTVSHSEPARLPAPEYDTPKDPPVPPEIPAPDPADYEEAARAVEAAQEKVNRALIETARRTLAAEDAQRQLRETARRAAKDTDVYRKAALGVAEAEQKRAEATARTRDAVEALRKVGEGAIEVEVSAATARGELESLARDYTARIEVEADTKDAEAELDAVTRDRTVKIDIDKKAFEKFGRGIDKVLSAVGTAALAPLFTSAAVAITGLGGALVAVVAAASAASGVIVGLPAVIGAAAAVMLTLKVATNGVGEAFSALAEDDAEALDKALKKLAPEAQKFIKAFKPYVSTFKAVRKEIQNNLFEGLTRYVAPLVNNYLPALRKLGFGLAADFNVLAQRVAQFFLGAYAIRTVPKIFDNIRAAISPITDVGYELVTTFLDIAKVGSDALPRAGQAIADLLSRFSVLILKARDSGALARFFEGGIATSSQLARILGNVALGIARIFKAGATEGQGFLDSLEEITAKFAAFTGSAAGQSQLKQFFADSATVVRGLAGIITYVSTKVGELYQAFSRLPEPVKAVAAPVLAIGGALAFVAGKLAVFGPAFAAIGSAAAAIGAGPLTLIVGTIAALAAGFVYAYRTSEKFRDLVSSAFSTLGTVVTQTYDTVKPALDLIGSVLSDTIRPAVDRAVDAFSGRLQPVITEIGRVFRDDVQPALKTLVAQFVAAEPEIRKVAAVLAILIESVGNSRGIAVLGVLVRILGVSFKIAAALVGSALNSFRAVVGTISFFIDRVKAAPGQVGKALAAVGAFFSNLNTTIVGAVRGAVASVGRFFSGIGASIAGGASSAAGAIGTLFSAIGARITAALSTIGKLIAAPFVAAFALGRKMAELGVSGVVKAVAELPFKILAYFIDGLTRITVFLTGAFNTARVAVATGINTIVGFVTALPGRVAAAASSLGLRLLGVITSAWNSARAATIAGAAAVISFFASLPDRARSAASSLGYKLLGVVTSAWNSARAGTAAGANGVVGFFKALPERARSAASSLVAKLSSLISSAWSAAVRATGAGIASVVSRASGLGNAIVGVLKGVVGRMRSIGSDIVGGLAAGISSGIGRVRDAAARLASAVPGPVRKILGISSPSKVMARIGRDTVRGLEVGLLDRMSALGQVVSQVAGLVTVSASTGLGDLSALASAPASRRDLGPTVAPAGGVTRVYNATLNAAPTVPSEDQLMRMYSMLETLSGSAR